MYSTKNIENILLAEIRNKKGIVSDSLNENTRNRYKYFNNVEEVKEALNQPEFSQAVEAYKNNQIIYRGDNLEVLGAYVIPGIRVSADGEYNVYTKLLSDILPSWREYPKRNRAAICTNDYKYTNLYGNRYCIFPINDTKIGICSKNDIWASFIELSRKYSISITQFNTLIVKLMARVLNTYEAIIAEYFREDTNTVIQLFNSFEPAFKMRIDEYKTKNNVSEIDINKFRRFIHLDVSIEYYRILSSLVANSEKNISLLQFFNKLLNPENNGFQLGDINSIPEAVRNIGSQELWFSAPYLMVNEDVIEQIL